MALSGKLGAFWSSVSGFDSANLLTNPDFETGNTTGWTATNASVTSADVFEGFYACALAGDGTTAASVEQATSAGSISAGDVVVVRCAAKASGSPSADATLKLEFFDSSDASLGSTSAAIPKTATSWERYSLIHTAPANTSYVKVSVACSGLSDSYIVDDFQLCKLEQVGGFSNWSVDVSVDTAEVTAFEDAPWRSYVVTQKGWTASASRYWGSEDFFEHLTNGNPIYCVFYFNEDGDERLEGLAYVTGVSDDVPVDSVVTEDITFQGIGDLSYHTT